MGIVCMKNDKSKSQLRFENYLDHFIKSDYFQLEIKQIREKFGLSASGYPAEDLDKKSLRDFMVYFPVQLAGRKYELLKPINLALGKIKFPVRNTGIITHIFKLYLFHNINFYNLFEEFFVTRNNLCDLVVQYDDTREYQSVVEVYFEKRMRETEVYPLAIQFHQNVSQRSLVDFIERNWKLIEYYQSEISKNDSSVASKVGRVRSGNKRIRERDTFIYENRSKSYQDISNLVMKQFKDVSDSIDAGSVGKIIQLEKKKRKEV
jgi:hypothetical protein